MMSELSETGTRARWCQDERPGSVLGEDVGMQEQDRSLGSPESGTGEWPGSRRARLQPARGSPGEPLQLSKLRVFCYLL